MVRFKRIPIKPAAGGGVHFPLAEKSIRLARYGCTNRPFYHIVVNMKRRHQHDQPIEQLGTFDPLPNKYNESLVSLNIERLRYWLSHRTTVSKPVAVLLGISGFLPMHPSVFIRAWKIRAKELQYQSEKLEENQCVDSEENKPEDSDKNT